jgi:uncharacterized GH25 family protein
MHLSARSRRVASVIFLFALTIRGAAGAQTVPTNGAPEGPRTGMILGRVVDSLGSPVPEAIVQLTMPKFTFDLPTTPKGRVMADGDGRFFFMDLPAGDYYVQATKEGYAPGAFNQRQPSGRSSLVPLREGEKRTDITLRVWKYAVIAGTVVDEAGEPAVGIAVRALVRDIVAGRAQFGSEPWLVPSTLTDDRGMFRFARMEAGTYAIVAPSMQTTVPVSVMSTMQPATLRTALFWAGIQETTLLGQPRTQQMGTSALMTLSGVLIPPPASATGRLSVYRTTYFPSATTAGEATPITVRSGDERTDLTITLRPAPAVRISGRLVTPDGSTPPPTAIRLTGEAMSNVVTRSLPSGPADVGFETVTGLSDAAGRFTLLGVPPGEYLITEADSFLSRTAREGRTPYWVAQRVTVGNEDLEDLVVNLRPALRVDGRIELRGGSAEQPVPPIVSFETPFGQAGFAAERTRDVPNGFSTVAPGGQYIARPVETGGWFVESVTTGGKDVTDRAFDLDADTSLVVTYTNQPSKVSGTVKDTRGNTSPNAEVLVFPADPMQWVGYGKSPRTIKSVSASMSGEYTFAHLPPGDYNVIAIDAAESDGWKDPRTLEMLAGRAMKLTVAAGNAPRAFDLTLRSIR